MRQTEEPVVRPDWLVDDIEAAVTPSNVGPLCLVQYHYGSQEPRMSDLDPTEITEQMRTFHAEDLAEQFAWMLHSPMWRTISARFYTQHSIDLRKHVKSIIK